MTDPTAVDPIAVDITCTARPAETGAELAHVTDNGATVTIDMGDTVIRCDRAELLNRLGIAPAITNLTARRAAA
jgi:hypothetical protein